MQNSKESTVKDLKVLIVGIYIISIGGCTGDFDDDIEFTGHPGGSFAIEDAANALLPLEALESGYELHYQFLEADDRHDLFRISYRQLEPHEDGLIAAGPRYSMYLGLDRETGEITECSEPGCAIAGISKASDKGSKWTLVSQDAPRALASTLVVRFFEHTVYSGTSYGLYTDVTNTGLFEYGLPYAGSVGMNDMWSSFYTIDAVCSTCRVAGLAHDVYDVKVWKDANYSGKWFEFGGDDYDSDFTNDRWYDNFLQGRIDNEVSSFKVKMSVFTPQVICGDGICEGNETISSCRADCGYCGDDVCYGSETASSCRTDCGYCGDGVCYGSETISSCRADCGYCGDGICYGSEGAYSCYDDCGYCGDGYCSGPENTTNCSSDCTSRCLKEPCPIE